MTATSALRRASWLRGAGLTVVLALHVAGLYGLWVYRLAPAPPAAAPLFVELITPPPASKPEPPPKPAPPRQAKLTPRPLERPQPQQLVAQAPVQSPHEPVALAALPQIEAPAPQPKPAEALSLAAELAVSCPERTPPAYPALSRRLGEAGRVTLRVELDERGIVAAVRVANSSGAPRLDDAAAAAVKTWRCNPAQRDGRAVRAVALQTFNFTLEGR
ncbi:MAG: TonB family protein [Hydrogenophilales bacterium]|nr:TonB family protein [Hydrogenophilales bacterium]